MPEAFKVIAIIPAYNEEATIVRLVEAVIPLVDDVIVVDDGSVDGTPDLLRGLNISYLRNEKNIGKGGSLQRGFHAAIRKNADYVITLDGDGQHLPSDIPLLLEAAKTNRRSIIIAARLKDRDNAPWVRRFANRFADFWISWAAGYPIMDTQSGFRLYPTEVIREQKIRSGPDRGFVFESELLIEAAREGVYSSHVPITSIYHPGARRSHYVPARDTWRIILMVAAKLLKKGMYPIGLLRVLHILPTPR